VGGNSRRMMGYSIDDIYICIYDVKKVPEIGGHWSWSLMSVSALLAILIFNFFFLTILVSLLWPILILSLF
jgi:hypothetical protein